MELSVSTISPAWNQIPKALTSLRLPILQSLSGDGGFTWPTRNPKFASSLRASAPRVSNNAGLCICTIMNDGSWIVQSLVQVQTRRCFLDGRLGLWHAATNSSKHWAKNINLHTTNVNHIATLQITSMENTNLTKTWSSVFPQVKMLLASLPSLKKKKTVPRKGKHRVLLLAGKKGDSELFCLGVSGCRPNNHHPSWQAGPSGHPTGFTKHAPSFMDLTKLNLKSERHQYFSTRLILWLTITHHWPFETPQDNVIMEAKRHWNKYAAVHPSLTRSMIPILRVYDVPDSSFHQFDGKMTIDQSIKNTPTPSTQANWQKILNRQRSKPDLAKRSKTNFPIWIEKKSHQNQRISQKLKKTIFQCLFN